MPTTPTVLLIDDEEHVRAYVAMLLRDTFAAVRVIEAADGARALALYAERRPDLVLLDINLVGESGLDVLAALLKADPDAIVVMLTSVNVRHVVEAAQAQGASGYIMKDSTPDEMAESIREVVAQFFELEGGAK